MGGSYPETDVARASLYQMNEISRRAGEAGMTFGSSSGGGAGGGGGTSVDGEDGGGEGDGEKDGERTGKGDSSGRGSPVPGEGQTQTQMRQQSGASRIMAAGLGLMAPPEGETGEPMSRADALAAIEELQRNRPQSRLGGGVGAESTGAGAAGSSSATAEGGPSGSSSSQQQQQQQQQTAAQVSGSDPFIMPPSPTPGEASSSSQAQDAMQGFGSASTIAHEGLQVFTLGHLMPRSGVDDANGNWTFDASSLDGLLPLPLGDVPTGSGPAEGVPVPEGGDGYAMNGAGPSSGAGSGSGYADASGSGGGGMRPPSAQKLRVRRTAFVPGWSVPPRVLLVEDDAVSRKLSSKFLQVFGCTIDVAVDGMAAVNKMNLEKYDLVLMVRFFLSSYSRLRAGFVVLWEGYDVLMLILGWMWFRIS